MFGNKLKPFLRGALVGGTFLALVLLERRRPLRRETEPRSRRMGRNLLTAALGAAALQLAEAPLITRLSRTVERRRWGLVPRLRLPAFAERWLAIMLLDYTLYLWHVLTHRQPWLWRFHVVHHADLDLDAATALRFHFGELLLSIPWRAAQVILIGVTPRTLSTWQTFVFISILFHHSNVELPIAFERALNRFVVTPRMHGIHHSIVKDETNSNWSSGLTIWDWLHGTLRLNVPQSQVTIGVPAYRQPRDVTLSRLLLLPFSRQRPTWRLPGAGEPVRARIRETEVAQLEP